MIAIYPKIIHLAKARHIETLACAVREYYGEQQAYAKSLDVWRFCQSIGIGLRERDSVAGGLARIVARDERGQFEIVIERDAKMSRTLTDQLLIAHLLGHGFLDLLPKIAEGEIRSPAVFTEGVVPILSSYEAEGLWKSERSLDRERDADHFALALLLPKRFTLAAWEKFRNLEKVARFFRLPSTVIRARFDSLGLSGDESTSAQAIPRPPQYAQARSSENSIPPSTAARGQSAYRAAPAEPKLLASSVPGDGPKPRFSAASASAFDEPAPKVSRPSRQGQRQASRSPLKKGASQRAPLQGISQLRELAKKIDGSVDL